MTTKFQMEQRRINRIIDECQDVSHDVMGRPDADCREAVNKLSALVCELACIVLALHKSNNALWYMVAE